MTNSQKNELTIAATFMSLVFLTIVGLAVIPWSLTSWVAYAWGTCSVITVFLMIKTNTLTSRPIGSIMALVFSPCLLATTVILWVFTKLGWYKP